MIKILPTEKFTITTHLRPDRVEAKLLNYVEPYQLIRFSFPFAPPPDKPYEGKVENGYFRIQKISRYKKRNNLPIIEGKISPEQRGSIINIIIKPNKLLNFMMFFLPLFYASLIGFGLLSNSGRTMVFPLFAFFFGCIFYFIFIKSFKSDLKKDKQFLLEIFNSN
ncbi:MAG: hypothetical protein VKN72_12995 [Nostocales cyanobacterium 94392]|nr:hypothetical protein [Nostocales cyanobacterium 94392]